MSTIVSIAVDSHSILQDALQILNAPLPSGVYSLDALTFDDYSRDIQFSLFYDMLVAVHGRDMIMRVEPLTGHLEATVCGADRSQRPWQVLIEFADADQAMLFKLAHSSAS